MQRENNGQKTQRARRFAVRGKYSNARFYGPDKLIIEGGDICLVKPGAPYESGDLVLVECECRIHDTPHHHALVFNKLHGKKYSFVLTRYNRDGRRYLAGDEKIIVGPIVKVIKNGKPERAISQADVPEWFEWACETLGLEGFRELKDLIEARKPIDEIKDYLKTKYLTPPTPREQDIEAKRKKLASLRAECDLADESAIFRLEREIYDLEHKLDEDEWPEIIGEVGNE